MIGLTTDEIYGCLKSLIKGKDRVVVIHSSLPQLGRLSPEFKWSILGALRKLLMDGHTIALPTFTFSFCQGSDFHYLESRSETGILGDWFLGLNGVQRTHHAIYSFAVAGKGAQQIIGSQDTTTFGEKSPFGLFDKLDATLVMLGCGWKHCTQFHYYEQEAKVPYRFFKTFQGKADFGCKTRQYSSKMFVRNLSVNPKNDFDFIMGSLYDENSIVRRKLGDGIVESVSCSLFGSICRKHLVNDKYSLLLNPEVARYNVDNLLSMRNNETIRVALVGSSNLDILSSEIKTIFNALIPSRKHKVFKLEFGRLHQNILDEESDLYQFSANFTFFVDRLEDVLKIDILQNIEKEKLNAVEVYTKIVRKYSDNNSGVIFVNTFEQLTSSIFKNEDQNQDRGLTKLLNTSNYQLNKLSKNASNINLFDLKGAIIEYEGKVFDQRLWYLGRFPYSKKFSQFLIKRYASLILSAIGESVRLILVDLDNTLWGGVLGEDGIENIQLGGDFPGNAFLGFQNTLKELNNRGVALGILSKNNEDEALEAIQRLPNMVITENVISAYAINWEPKWKNLIRVSKEIGLDFRNILFIDDNPIEREQIRINLPGVRVLDMPDDPALYSSALLNSPYVESFHLTNEDMMRGRQYSSKFKIENKKKDFSKLEDFYKYIQPKVTVFPLNMTNTSRAVQLIAKTNQFNTTSIRYTQKELEVLQKNGCKIYVLGYEDIFSDFENIGVAVIDWSDQKKKKSTLELLLLSCRVLGRGIECGFFGWWLEKSSRMGMDTLVGKVKCTSRNTPVHKLFKKNGFYKKSNSSEWFADIKDSKIKISKWVHITEKEG
ncbi:HAD-IIIC family phosphatase [Candidatus Woesearchaeota archaeon]|mgnify:CR=1 FL=1|jgi:FkbH-like protein|nr:HAD-IIIC family phosphatase [Candidatus Woesearchaeota archaeon]MBT5399554.1 HAD-IIIC family phosphatase [bacterium]